MTRGRRGATLVETAIAIAVFALAVAASAPTLAMAARLRASASDRRTAASIAAATVDRLAALPYADPRRGSATLGPESGESGDPAGWNDVDDPRNWKGTPEGFDPASGWTVAIEVDRVLGDAPGTTSVGDEGLKRVVVRVLRHDRERARIVVLRSELR